MDEQAFRYNNRNSGRKDANGRPVKRSDAERLEAIARQLVGKRITYEKLTGKEGETAAF